jgi:hypothetical protein
MRLFKYYSREKYLFDVLENKRLFFSSFREYNDPYEIFTYIVDTKTNSNFVNRSVKDIVKACCFSKSNMEYLLWSHYANSHKGFCVEFDFSDYEIDSIYPNVKTYMLGNHEVLCFPIIYEQFVLNKECENGIPCFSKNDIIDITSHKYEFWKYEKEVRLLCFMNRSGYIEIPGTTIRSISIGMLAFDKRVEYIKKRVNNLGYNIPCKKMSLAVNIGRVI